MGGKQHQAAEHQAVEGGKPQAAVEGGSLQQAVGEGRPQAVEEGRPQAVEEGRPQAAEEDRPWSLEALLDRHQRWNKEEVVSVEGRCWLDKQPFPEQW